MKDKERYLTGRNNIGKDCLQCNCPYQK